MSLIEWQKTAVSNRKRFLTPNAFQALPEAPLVYLLLIGTPGEIRTPDLWFRRPLLYPAELQGQINIKKRTSMSYIF